MNTTIQRTVAQHPLFEHLQDRQMERLLQLATYKKFSRNELVFMPCEPSDNVYILLEGSIKLGAISVEGREVIKHILYPTALFGEMGLVGEEMRHDFAIALERENAVLAIPTADFRRFVHTDYVLTIKIMNAIGSRLRTAEHKLESMVFKDARSRIIEFLKETASKRGRRVGLETLIRNHLTQQDIADLTGTSRQTVTTVLNELRSNNRIYFNRSKILIRDLATL